MTLVGLTYFVNSKIRKPFFVLSKSDVTAETPQKISKMPDKHWPSYDII